MTLSTRTSRVSRRSIIVAGSAAAGALLLNPVTAVAAPSAVTGTSGRELTVGAGESLTVSTTTTRLIRLTIASGGSLAAPDGYNLSLTVDGVETGQLLTATGGTITKIQPGVYRGDVVLTMALANPVAFGSLTFPFRQALYVDADGVSRTKSVLAGVVGGQVTDAYARNIRLASTGEAFNGVYVAGGSYTLRSPSIAFDGNGRCDFVGYGAALVATGTSTTLVVEDATIANHGAVRTAVIADGGSNVIVKNSTIQVKDGVLPSDYRSTVDTSVMESAPWMLSIGGNVRATNLLGTSTRATYINSTVQSENWGALSTDNGQNGTLTAINCRVGNTGDAGGYGSYAIGNATENFLGCQFDVATYATINRGGTVYYADSTRAAVAALNTSLELGLSARELATIPVRNTVINSKRFGVMWHGAGNVDISGGTVLNSRASTFLDKGQQVSITVDGSGGARLNPGNGIIVQVMENDDPGPQMVNGVLLNTGVYYEPTTAATKDASFDPTTAHSTDAVASFTDIRLKGDFYNGMRGGLNLVLTFTRSQVEGTISATTTKHHIDTIGADQYLQLGEVTNTTAAGVNNGVIVTLATGSRWTVTGTSYLTRLTLAADATVTGPRGRKVTMTVDGVTTAITAGSSYSGAIVIAAQ
ncbi:hypothetical protein EDD99_1558 [Streptomyces sp. 846.5]|nr:hypothetical protein [Streptomyces sp. 846.5]TDU03141.1 hypothetical protein EDD99_1558 [Streptomyces sp. 846.5]